MKNIYSTNSSTSVTPDPNTFTSKAAYQNHLVATHLPLVKKLACYVMLQFKNSYTLCLEDLISAGDEALVLASRKFDPAKGIPFAAYARKAVENAMRNEIRRLLPVDLKSAWKTDFTSFSYGKAFDDSVFNPGDSDNLESNLLKLNENRNWLCNWDEEEQCLKEQLKDTLGRLPSDDKTLIEDYYGFNGDALTLEKLGELRRVTLQAVGKRKKRIIKQLHDNFDGNLAYRRCA